VSKEYVDLQGKYFHRIYTLIEQENQAQIQKWGIQSHNLYVWYAIIAEEIGEIAKAILQYEHENGDKEAIIKESIQSVTLLLKLIEMLKNTNEEAE
jgi:NTP pyrophosphatase (non-canonical NTP hydrolase)